MGFLTGLVVTALGVQAASSLYGAHSAAKAAEAQGKAARRAALASAELAEYNAAVADVQARDAVARGAIEEQQFRRDLDVLIGAQRAGYAAGNIDVGYGSAVDVQADAAFLGELDALTIRTNAAREAWGYQVEAVDLRRRAVLARREGVLLEQAGRAEAHGYRVGGALSAAGTIAGGTASLLQARYGFNQGTRRPGGVLERVTTPRGGPYAPRGAYA
ncbi:MAG TPA: hypothetical protein VKE26_26320 [Xanthobacteraceae bacterium]|nr:hypothetical protein [Xanthobacteraceae bacterium]